MARPLVIIHGWSDSSDSFKKLARDLRASNVASDITTIDLGEYESLNDTVNLDDVAFALDRIWKQKGLPTAARSVDIITHSTGALVVRNWLTTSFTDRMGPVFHFVMLAPANFGSPLAHKGRSFIGRVLKGWKADHPGEVGEMILDSLELASRFSWDLALKDCLAGTGTNPYSSASILATVLVGNEGYDGIRSIANEPGTDGTVRVATANLNCIHLTADFANPVVGQPIPMRQLSGVAFRVLRDENHGSIVDGTSSENRETFALICEALTLAPAAYDAFASRLASANKADWLDVTAGKAAQHAYNNVVMRVRDDRGRDIDNYLIEFFVAGETDTRPAALTRIFNEDVIESVHCYDRNKAYRSFHLDISELMAQMATAQDVDLRFSLSATPAFRDERSAGYKSWKITDLHDVKIPVRPGTPMFQPFQTILVDITIPRKVGDDVFRLKRVP